ncbi:MAG: VOC family protein [Bacteroidota bacterium]
MSDSSSIQYAYTILYVKDVVASMAFYRRVFDLSEKFVTPEQDYGELITGTTVLAFANLTLANSNFASDFQVSEPHRTPFGIELAFSTMDVADLMAKAQAAGGTLLAEVKTKPWGQQVGYVRDLNGFIIEICTPMPTSK